MQSNLYVQIEPTTRCNFSCGFCPRHHLEQGDMDLDVFEQIIEGFKDINLLQLYGEGEPFLHSQFFTMVQIAKSNQIKISTISNGSLLGNCIDQILLSEINSIHISLESLNPSQFKRLRGGDIVKIENNINLLNEQKKRCSQSLPLVGLSVTVLRETHGELDCIFDFYNRLHMNAGIIIQPLNKMQSYADNYNSLIECQSFNNDELDNINNFLETNNKFKKIQKEKTLTQTFFEMLRDDINVKIDGCPWLVRGFFVNFKGYVMPCSMIKNFKNFSFGQVGVNSADEILARRDAMRNQFILGCIPLPCKNCRTLDTDYVPGKMHKNIT